MDTEMPSGRRVLAPSKGVYHRAEETLRAVKDTIFHLSEPLPPGAPPSSEPRPPVGCLPLTGTLDAGTTVPQKGVMTPNNRREPLGTGSNPPRRPTSPTSTISSTLSPSSDVDCAVAVKESAVRFPRTRSILWDRTPVGAALILHPHLFVPSMVFESSLGKALLALLKSGRETAFLIGRLFCPRPESEVQVIVEHVDGGHGEQGIKRRPVVQRHGTLCFHLCGRPKDSPTPLERTVDEYHDMLHEMASLMTSRVFPQSVKDVSVMTVVCAARSDPVGSVDLRGDVIMPASPVDVTPILPLRIIPTPLSRSLTELETEGPPQAGFVTMDQARRVLLLLPTDSKAFDVPLVGIWVSGVRGVKDVSVWGACLQFLRDDRIKDRASMPGGAHLLIVCEGRRAPSFHEFSRRDSPRPFTRLQFQHRLSMGNGAAAPVAVDWDALGDQASDQRFVKALRREGYTQASPRVLAVDDTPSQPVLAPENNEKETEMNEKDEEEARSVSSLPTPVSQPSYPAPSSEPVRSVELDRQSTSSLSSPFLAPPPAGNDSLWSWGEGQVWDDTQETLSCGEDDDIDAEEFPMCFSLPESHGTTPVPPSAAPSTVPASTVPASAAPASAPAPVPCSSTQSPRRLSDLGHEENVDGKSVESWTWTPPSIQALDLGIHESRRSSPFALTSPLGRKKSFSIEDEDPRLLAQQREIDTLRAEINTLRRQLSAPTFLNLSAETVSSPSYFRPELLLDPRFRVTNVALPPRSLDRSSSLPTAALSRQSVQGSAVVTLNEMPEIPRIMSPTLEEDDPSEDETEAIERKYLRRWEDFSRDPTRRWQ